MGKEVQEYEPRFVYETVEINSDDRSVKVDGLIDSGAYTSLMNASFLKRYNLWRHVDTKSKPRLVGPDVVNLSKSSALSACRFEWLSVTIP